MSISEENFDKLPISPKDASIIKKIVWRGLLLSMVSMIVDYALSKNKKKAIDSLKAFSKVFIDSLTDGEKEEFSKMIKEFTEKRVNVFRTELGKDFSPDEINQIFNSIFQQFLNNSLLDGK